MKHRSNSEAEAEQGLAEAEYIDPIGGGRCKWQFCIDNAKQGEGTAISDS
jgi:hypothetical protein